MCSMIRYNDSPSITSTPLRSLKSLNIFPRGRFDFCHILLVFYILEQKQYDTCSAICCAIDFGKVISSMGETTLVFSLWLPDHFQINTGGLFLILKYFLPTPGGETGGLFYAKAPIKNTAAVAVVFSFVW